MKRVLVLSPHPDDESIGCGGTLRRHIVEGDVVHAIFLTSGEKGGHGCAPEKIRHIREQEARVACGILGIAQIEFYHAPDGALQATKSLVDRLRGKLQSWQPDLVYLPHQREMHTDHQATVRLTKRALVGLPKPGRVLLYEIWTPLQAIDEIVDISDYVETKRAAILAYESQCAVMSFDAAILGLNRYRGEMHSWPGGDYAEIFEEMHL